MITDTQIKKLCPSAKPALVAAIVAGWPKMQADNITTPRRVKHFICTLATETGGFRAIDENLSYTAKRLTQVWPSRFKSLAAAKPYARNPEKLANKVYGGRLGNGPASSGDGWRYRGGGFIQTTGRSNYRAAGHEADPDTLRQPVPGFQAAVKFWSDNRINAIADTDNAAAVRKKVNGGTNGLGDYRAYLAKAEKAHLFDDLSGTVPVKASTSSGYTVSQIMDVQRALIRHGYVKVGATDGIMGDNTRGAIRDFRAKNNLPAGDTIDTRLIEVLSRPVVVEPYIDSDRANATVADLRAKGSTTIAGTDAQKLGTLAAGGGTVAAPLLKALGDSGDQVSDLTDKLSPFQTFIQFAGDYLWVAVLVVVVIVGWQAFKIAKARLRDHQTNNTSVVGLSKVQKAPG